MPFYLQDSGSAYWQLGVSTDGREQNTGVGAQTIVALVVQDTNLVYWQLAITTTGKISPSVVSPATVSTIILTDSTGSNWTLGITTNGRVQLSKPSAFEPCDDAWMPPINNPFDAIITVW